MEDEGLLLSDPATRPRRCAGLGAPRRRRRADPRPLVGDRAGARRRTKPPGFDAADPDDPALPVGGARQRRRAWCAAEGMKVMLTITGPGPLWAAARRHAATRAGSPNPIEYARFARAVARRYQGRSSATCSGTSPTSRVGCSRSGTPACAATARRSRRTCTAVWCALPSRAIHAVDPNAEVVIGELAPIGGAAAIAIARRSRRCRSCARWAASTPPIARSRRRAAAASRPPTATASATTRTRSRSRRTSATRTATRRSSPTSGGCSRCSTS